MSTINYQSKKSQMFQCPLSYKLLKLFLRLDWLNDRLMVIGQWVICEKLSPPVQYTRDPRDPSGFVDPWFMTHNQLLSALLISPYCSNFWAGRPTDRGIKADMNLKLNSITAAYFSPPNLRGKRSHFTLADSDPNLIQITKNHFDPFERL